MRRRAAALVALTASLLAGGAAPAQGATLDGRPPFTATVSNHTPLVFGMDVSEVSAALRQPLQYVGGPPGGEIYLALRNQAAAD